MLTNEAVDDIIKGCIALKRESQQRLYTSFYGYAMAVCLRFSANEEEAAEIANDGFLKAFQDLHRFAPRYGDHYGSLKGWLKKLMVHTAIDSYRRNHKHRSVVDLESHPPPALYGHVSIEKMSYEELRKLVQRLSPAYRTVFNLFAIDGYGHEEIAGLLGISVGTSKSNLAKARANLQHMIKQLDGEVYGRRAV